MRNLEITCVILVEKILIYLQNLKKKIQHAFDVTVVQRTYISVTFMLSCQLLQLSILSPQRERERERGGNKNSVYTKICILVHVYVKILFQRFDFREGWLG